MLETTLGSCGPFNQAASSGSPISNVATNSVSQNGCTMSGTGYSHLGVVGARASATLFTGDWSSGGVRARAVASWSDDILPTWNNRFSVLGASTFRLFFNVGATGGVSASAKPNSAGGSSAGIEYLFRIAGYSATGSQGTSSANPSTTIAGNWGTLSGYIDLPAFNAGNGAYSYGQVNLFMSGHASAGVGKLYQPGSIADATATTEFGSTLIWEGITGAQAFDAAGKLIELPNDFRLQLNGQANGADYWNSAQRTATVVPEPTTVLLVSTGLLAIAGFARRRRTA